MSNESPEMLTLKHMLKVQAEVTAMVTTELAEIRALLATVLGLQKAEIIRSGHSQAEVDAMIERMYEDNKTKFLSVSSTRMKQIGDSLKTEDE
jgi:hypothetical protein